MYDFEDVNRILAEMAEQDIVEPTVEPIDDPNVEVDFWDWAEVIGIVDEVMESHEEMWYVP